MDAARGPRASLGAGPRSTHDTLGQPGEQLGRPRYRPPLPAALVASNTGGNLACGGFA
jgi:hypothetical protein